MPLKCFEVSCTFRRAEKEQQQSWCSALGEESVAVAPTVAHFGPFLEAGNCVFFRLLQELATAGENQDAGQLRRLMTQESKHEASHIDVMVSNFFYIPSMT